VIVGGLLGNGLRGFSVACGPGTGTAAFPARDGTLTAPSATIDIELNCGEASVSTASGNGWRVEGEARNGTGPTIDADGSSLRVRSPDSDGDPFGAVGDRESWRITLPDAVRLDLKVDLNAGSSTMNLAGASLDALELNLNAGSVTLDIGSVKELGNLQAELNAGSLNVTLPNASLTGSIEANAGAVNLCVPPGAGLQLNTKEGFAASYDYGDHGLIKEGLTWRSPGFETAAVRIELDTHANAGSFSLDPEEGCGG
jgi:hypothetical protein